MEDIKNFILANWDAVIEFIKKLWKFACDTILKDDSIWAGWGEDDEEAEA